MSEDEVDGGRLMMVPVSSMSEDEVDGDAWLYTTVIHGYEAALKHIMKKLLLNIDHT